VLTERITVGPFGDEVETAFVRLFDDRTFEGGYHLCGQLERREIEDDVRLLSLAFSRVLLSLSFSRSISTLIRRTGLNVVEGF
jgi:hypothetical protein